MRFVGEFYCEKSMNNFCHLLTKNTVKESLLHGQRQHE